MAKSINDFHQEADRSKILALSSVLSAIVAVLTFMIIPFPPPVGGFDASSILILSLPILLGPEIGTIIVCLGEFVGTLFLMAVGLAFPYYLPGIIAVRGPEAYFVGKIGRSGLFGKGRETRRQLFAMALGPIWETAGFVVADYYIYYFLFGANAAVGASLILLSTLVDLIWVIPAMVVVRRIGDWLNTGYIETQLGLEVESETKRSLFKVVAILIVVTWAILLLVPFVLAGWVPPPS